LLIVPALLLAACVAKKDPELQASSVVALTAESLLASIGVEPEHDYGLHLHDLGKDHEGAGWIAVEPLRYGATFREYWLFCNGEFVCHQEHFDRHGRIDAWLSLAVLDELTFLRVRGGGGHGSGCGMVREEFWLLHPRGVSEALSVPVSGYVYGWGMPFDREFNGSVEIQHHPVRVVVSYEICFGTLFDYRGSAAYVWAGVEKGFVAESAADHDRLDGLYNDATDEFVERYEAQIRQMLGSSGPGVWVDWLHRLQESCRTPEGRLVVERLRSS
jgi:hypothetical protein